MQALKAQALAKIEAAYVKAEAHYNVKLTRVPVVFSAQQKTTAGTANFTYNRMTGKIEPKFIKLSLAIMQLNKEVFIESTPGHEAAHLIAVEVFGAVAKGHGPHWKQVMRVIGQEPKRCHSMQTARNNTTRIEVFCSCMSHQVTKQTAQKILAGHHYTCKKCKTRITLKGANIIEPKVAASVPVVKTAPVRVHNFNKPTKPVVEGVSKMSIVKLMMRNIKQERPELTMEQVLSVKAVVAEIATAAGLTTSLCRVYIKNNWSKV